MCMKEVRTLLRQIQRENAALRREVDILKTYLYDKEVDKDREEMARPWDYDPPLFSESEIGQYFKY